MSRWSEVHVEHRDQGFAGRGQTFGKRAGLEPAPDRAMTMLDQHAGGLQLGRHAGHHVDALVRRVVEDLDVQLVARPIESGHAAQRLDRHLVLVEHRDLQQDGRQVRLGQERPRQVVAPMRRPQEVVELDADEGQEAGRHHHQADDRRVEQNLEDAEDELMKVHLPVREPITCRGALVRHRLVRPSRSP